MRFSRLAVAVAASGGAIALSLFAVSPSVAAAADATSYQANLQALNNSGASGTLMLTLNGSEAKKIVAQIQPKEYIFPMHYGLKNFDDLLSIDEFLDEQDRAKIAKSLDNKVTLNRDAQRPRPLIVQLNFEPKAK